MQDKDKDIEKMQAAIPVIQS